LTSICLQNWKKQRDSDRYLDKSKVMFKENYTLMFRWRM